MFDLEYGTATDAGRVRDLNEDSIYADADLFVVADGMGGHAAGEVASALAVRTLVALIGNRSVQAEDLASAIGDVNEAIVLAARQDSATTGMGTTLSGVRLGLFGGTPHWFVFNVGDSRVYRIAQDVLQQVTIDHSEVEELVSAGQLTAQQARVHPRRNVVTRALGTTPAPVPDLWVLPAVIGETFIVCSDGLPLEVDDVDILAVAAREVPAQRIADELCAMAVSAGGRDNVSVIAVRLRGSGATRRADVATAPRSTMVGGD